MSEPIDQTQGRRAVLSLLKVLLGVLLTATILFCLLTLTIRPPHGAPPGLRCRANLRQLCVAMMLYAQDHNDTYPASDQWCDLLVSDVGDVIEEEEWLRCPQAKDARCSYAMNPNADPRSPRDMVLLFETDNGWNQAGGAELLGTERHGRCNVVFVDGSVELIKPDEVAGLKWTDAEKLPEELRNVRRPANDSELKYWLENMIWYHRFTTEEVRLATGLSEGEILAAQKRFGIWPAGRPERDADAPLLVLPYPGGRHPRIGFLEGAIDPQRETKFSVFTPWDPNSYAVVDLPEAIWSNLGLTYLAHTHVDTIWTKQGVELPRLEWNRRADGSLDFRRTLPNGLAFGAKVVATKEAVRMEMWLENGTTGRLTDLRVQNCVMPKMAAGFAAQTNENKVLTNPYVACRSEDGKRWIITAWEGCHRPWANPDCPCFHSDPKFPDLERGQRHVLRGWLSFYEGKDIEAEFARIEATGWRK